MTQTEIPPAARALGRVPSGLFIVSTRAAEGPVGFVGSFVMQAGFEPLSVSVAVGKARGPLAAIRENGHFGVSVLDAASRDVMGAFFKRYEEGQGPFDGLDVHTAAGDVPVLRGALAWMVCRVTGEYDAGDHVVMFGELVEGELVREGEPAVHTRKSGLDY